MTEIQRSLTMVVYGGGKVGKSSLAVTAPYPRLLLDIESGYKFLPIIPKLWDPLHDAAPPVADGTWDTCVVTVRDYETVMRVYGWLQSGQHQFKSLIIDSVSELQVKLLDDVAGSEQMKMQQWGEVLRHMGSFLRNIRDLTTHPTNPLEAIVLTSMAREGKDGRYHPYLQGQMALQIPYLFDVLGALAIETFPNPDPTQPPYRARRLYIENTPTYEAGERVQGRLGSVVEQQNLNIVTMLDAIYGVAPVAPSTPTV